jgi:hypothetical protein
MLTWGEFKDVLWRMLNDEVDDPLDHSFTPEMMLDAYRWATRQFGAHTAPRAEVTFDSDALKLDLTNYDMTEDYVFVMPADCFENPESSAIVYYTSGGVNAIIPPIRVMDKGQLFGTVPGYWTRFMAGRWHLQLNVGASAASDSLTVLYYAYYALPDADADVLEIPEWAEKAVAYLCGANILNQKVISASGTNQFNEVQELRGMELNGWRVQQRHYNELYKLEISHFVSQNRRSVLK